MATHFGGPLGGIPSKTRRDNMNPMMLDAYSEDLRARLLAHGLHHLAVDKRGSHLVIYALEPTGEKVNRARLTGESGSTFALSLPDRHERWQDTGERGSWEDLIALLLGQFNWVLGEW